MSATYPTLTFYVLWQKRYRKIGLGAINFKHREIEIEIDNGKFIPGLISATATFTVSKKHAVRIIESLFTSGALARFRAYGAPGRRFIAFKAFVVSGEADNVHTQFDLRVNGEPTLGVTYVTRRTR
jgi:hypothetical protein